MQIRSLQPAMLQGSVAGLDQPAMIQLCLESCSSLALWMTTAGVLRDPDARNTLQVQCWDR